jgi:phosphopantothenoylcysteine synthetase/decarboxylase
LSEKQINIFNTILKKEDLLEISPVTMEVTNSTTSPFSDKLITFLISTTTATSISLLAYAMSVSMRKDLTAHYPRLIA